MSRLKSKQLNKYSIDIYRGKYYKLDYKILITGSWLRL